MRPETRCHIGQGAILLEGLFFICGAHFCKGLVLVWGNLGNRGYLHSFSPQHPPAKSMLKKAEHIGQVMPEVELQPQLTRGEGDRTEPDQKCGQ